MSEDYLARIRQAVNDKQKSQDKQTAIQAEKDAKQLAHFEAFKAKVLTEIEPSLKIIQNELQDQGFEAQILIDFRDDNSAGAYNYNFVTLKFANNSEKLTALNESEFIIARNPEGGKIVFSKTIRTPGMTSKVEICKLALTEIDADVAMDLATAVVAEALTGET